MPVEQGRRTEIKALPDTVSPILVGKRPDAQRRNSDKNQRAGGGRWIGARRRTALQPVKGVWWSCDGLAAHSPPFRSRRGALRHFKESGGRTPNRLYLLFLRGSAVV